MKAAFFLPLLLMSNRLITAGTDLADRSRLHPATGAAIAWGASPVNLILLIKNNFTALTLRHQEECAIILHILLDCRKLVFQVQKLCVGIA